MPDDAVHVGDVTDAYGQQTGFYVSGGQVLLTVCGHVRRLNAQQQEAFAKAYVEACWQARIGPLAAAS